MERETAGKSTGEIELGQALVGLAIVYFDPARTDAAPVYRSGGAQALEVAPEPAPVGAAVEIPTNAYHALFAFGAIDRLNRLAPTGGPLQLDGEAIFFPGSLDDAVEVMYWAERQLYGREFELVVERGDGPRPVEYRLRLDRRAYTRTLLRLGDLFQAAARQGHGVRVWL